MAKVFFTVRKEIYYDKKSYLQQETRISSEKSKRYFQTVTWISVQ